MADNPMTESRELFAETPTGTLFMRAAIPGAAGMLVSSIYGVMDGVLVGRFVGETAFAAINLTLPFVILAFALGDLIGSGSAVPISISLGRGDEDRANQVFTCATAMNVITGLVLGITFFVSAPAIMAAMGATGLLARLATSYLRVYAIFLPFTTVLYAVDNYLRISGQIGRSFLVNLFMAVFGAALEYLLLGGLHLGVRAAAAAFSIAMTVSVALSFWPFVRGQLQLRFVRPEPTLEMVAEIVRLGMPVFLENVSGRLMSIILNAALLRLGGEEAVSVWGVLMFSDSIVVMLIYGTVDSLQPAVGFNWGAGTLSRVKSLELYCFATSAAFGLAYVLAAQTFPDIITLVFLPEAEPGLLTMSVHALRVFSLGFLIRWLAFATQSFMIAVGQAKLASLVSVVMALAAPLVTLVALWPLGLEGLWLNTPVASVLTAGVCGFVLLRFKGSVHERAAAAREGS
ncbi:MAG: MATE family efflux transporter [Atopobiaceae bacterium]|nr:MATE family efflux transporter [Atopobiaceae bacterium]